MRRSIQSLLLAAVPLYLNYQSVLLDSGGAPLPSGPHELTFRITDSQRHALYEETQVIDSQNGVFTSLIGNGTVPGTTAPTAGLTPDLFMPGEPRYLEVLLGGIAADDPLEIVSVPYALWSTRVAEGGVDGKAIVSGTISMDHFANGLVDDLATALLASPPFADFQKGLAAPGGAQQVGVNTTFIYSGATTVQGVLKDLDLAIKAREEKNVNKAGDQLTGTLTFKNGATVTGLPPAKSEGDAVRLGDLQAMTSNISGEKILDNSLTSADITDGTIGTADLGNDTVTGAKVIDGSLSGGDILDGTIASADITPNTIQTDRLNFDVATQAELDVVAEKIPPPVDDIALPITIQTGVMDCTTKDDKGVITNAYACTIPVPTTVPGDCYYHAAFAGTLGQFTTAVGAEAASPNPFVTSVPPVVNEIAFDMSANTVNCRVSHYVSQTQTPNVSISCKISYLIFCKK